MCKVTPPSDPRIEQTDKPEPVVSRLLGEQHLTINGKVYDFGVCVPEEGYKAHVRLSVGDPFSDDFEIYDVVLLEAGYYECTCADFIYRSGPSGYLCKHIRACRDLNLMNTPSVTEKEAADLDRDYDDGWSVADKDGNVYVNVATGEVEHL